ncbi:MAG: (2Fe-2S)-binding protein [Planctomycetota bacterium]|nr:(2Fe-2S)-binding protein [Planctomycetota bacterium]MDA1177526.1 (2Fe-2S)-binding protein [Planctomycetota bacterium]
MELDDELCLCFHVSQRKVLNYLRREQPVRASQLSECGGAGTGCGWCRPFLERLFVAANQPASAAATLPAAQEYQKQREQHIAAGHGKPPSQTDPDDPQRP